MKRRFDVLLFVLLLLQGLVVPSVSWTLPRHSTRVSLQTLHASSSNNDNSSNKNNKEETKQDLQKRMAVVRSLQESFYKSDQEKSKSPSQLEPSTGRLVDLPLWRVPWWEVPGRSNVLNVHEPMYTNMFETILRGPKPWCFGHLYSHQDEKDKNGESKSSIPLQTWESTKSSTFSSSSAVLGCLMNISDYRRLSDGRLLLLVHAMGRFVVTDIQQTLPYAVVNAQILPDAEEVDCESTSLEWSQLLLETTEVDWASPRAAAVREAVRFHDYEYDRQHVLPIGPQPNDDTDAVDLDVNQVVGSAIAKVLPYCPFSKTLEPPVPSPRMVSFHNKTNHHDNNDKETTLPPPLEYRLLQKGVLHAPLFDPDYTDRQDWTRHQLEYELWLRINQFLIQTKMPVSPVLLGLLPPNQEWPKKSFVLKPIVQELSTLDQEDMEHDFVLVSPDYPAHRRQRRLSYCAAHLLEKTANQANQLRPTLLQIPSTQQRLRYVLERFDQWQEQSMGEFQ